MIGGKAILSDGDLKIAALMRNTQQALEAFNPSTQNFLNTINSNMVLELERFSLVIKCRENTIECSLDVEQFRILKPGVKWNKPKPLSHSDIFETLKSLVLKGHKLRTPKKPPLKAPSKTSTRTPATDDRRRQITPEPQQASRAHQFAIASNPERSGTDQIEEKSERLETPRRMIQTREPRSPLLEISPKTAQRNFMTIDIKVSCR
jgi:hypothetical protein